MKRLPACLVLLMIGLAALPASAQERGEFGRLFLTPEQRSTLDARRRARVPDKPAATIIESPVTRIDGVVSRRGGKSTVWVNGVAIPEGTQPEGMRVTPRRSDLGRVAIGLGEADVQVDLKIGQSFDRGTGEVKDALEGGEVSVKTPSAGGAKK